jgi:hypothetical protein
MMTALLMSWWGWLQERFTQSAWLGSTCRSSRNPLHLDYPQLLTNQ